jgi:outer membrane protein
MKSNRNISFWLLTILGIVLPIGTLAQEVLTIEDAVAIALENNFEIRIAKNELKIDETNITLGNAGILPSLNAVATNNNTVLNTTQKQSNGNEVEIDGARNTTLNYGLALEWTIFDGFKMFARHNQLKELKKLGETELKANILTNLSDVYESYYTIHSLEEQLKTLDSIIYVSEMRLTTAKNRFSIGKASKLEVLNAEVDLNADASTLVLLRQEIAVAKIQLNNLLARKPDTNFTTEIHIVLDKKLQLTDLLTLAESQNPQLQIQHINRKIQEYELKQIKGNRYPNLSLNSGYTFNNSKSPFGFVTETNGTNFSYGFTATLNIFNGFNQNRNEKVAKLQLENTQLVIDQQRQTIQAQIASLYQNFSSLAALAELEEKNEKIANQNLEITLEKFKIGTLTPIEFRTAQNNYANAKVRYLNAILNAKLAEITLKELTGSLDF